MTPALRLLVSLLACFRLAELLAGDDGPGDVIRRWRQWAGAYDYGPERGPDGEPQPRTSLGRLVSCPYCLGVWLAAALAGLNLRPSWLGDAFLTWWGLAGAQSWLQGGRDLGGR